MNVSQQLRAAKALIDAPLKWLQYDYFKEHNGQDCYCSVGAAHKVLGNYWETSPDKNILTEALGKVVGGSWELVAKYNDSHTHEEVMIAWDKAIAMAEQDEQHCK